VKDAQGGRESLQEERSELEKKLRRVEGQRQALQEDLDIALETAADAERDTRRKETEWEAKVARAERELEQAREEIEGKDVALHTAQQRLAERERECGEMEGEVLKLKSQGSNAEEVEVLRKEMSDQVAHVRKLETTNRTQLAELEEYRKQKKSIDVVEEEKRSLETKLRLMNELRTELAEVRLRNDALEDEKSSWSSYLESQSSGDEELQFESPEELARAFMRVRLEQASLLNQLGTLQPEISTKEEEIRSLQDQKLQLQKQVEELKSSAGSSTGLTSSTSTAKLERQKKLAVKETEYLRAQLKLLDSEEAEMHPDRYSESQNKRITELESLVDEYRKEVDTLSTAAEASETKVAEPITTLPLGSKRPLDESSDERLGELLRKNKQLQESFNEIQTRAAVLESELKAKSSQLHSFKSSSRYRVLELKNNPTSTATAIKQQTLDTLRDENTTLLEQLAGRLPTKGVDSNDTLVPRASLKKLELELQDKDSIIASRDKSLLRLRSVFAAKGLEFREAVFSLLGWQLNFQQNGKVKATSMFYPTTGDEHFIEFDGENGTMKVSGGPQSEYAKEIRGLIEFWVDGKGQVPCFLAAMTLEFFEKYGDDKPSR
jgi:mitotic spindle assembly checkpoint protein MAD1